MAGTWIAKSGSEDRVKDILARLAQETRREPGCVKYVAHQSRDDSAHFVLYEVYRDPNALRAHSESGHFNRYVLRRGGTLS